MARLAQAPQARADARSRKLKGYYQAMLHASFAQGYARARAEYR